MHRLLLVLLSAALCIGWMACSKDKEQEEESTEESVEEGTEESAEESTEESVEEGTEESAEESNVTVDEYGIATVQAQLNEPFPMPHNFEAIILSAERVETTGAIVADTELYLSRPQEGFVFVVVTYSRQNKGTQPGFPQDILQLVGGDDVVAGFNAEAGANYLVHQLYPGQDPPYGNYQPGETRMLAMVFELPEEVWEAGGAKLVYETAGWGEERPTIYHISLD